MESIPFTYSSARDMTVVHHPVHGEQQISRLNARDLMSFNQGWSWGPAPVTADAADAAPAEEVPDEVLHAPDPEEDEVVGEPPEAEVNLVVKDPVLTDGPPAEPIDVNEMFLTDAAMHVSGSDDLKSYLEGFPFSTLRALSKEKFGKMIHHRATKETAVQKLLEFEEARIMATAD